MNLIKRIKDKLHSDKYYVIADPADNSITLSKKLFDAIKANADKMNKSSAKVFVFKIVSQEAFGFCIVDEEKDFEQPTQVCDIQYNGKYKCIGFETLCPSVGTIFYNYELPADKRIKLSVSIHKTNNERTYYQIDRPNAKHIRKFKKG